MWRTLRTPSTLHLPAFAMPATLRKRKWEATRGAACLLPLLLLLFHMLRACRRNLPTRVRPSHLPHHSHLRQRTAPPDQDGRGADSLMTILVQLMDALKQLVAVGSNAVLPRCTMRAALPTYRLPATCPTPPRALYPYHPTAPAFSYTWRIPLPYAAAHLRHCHHFPHCTAAATTITHTPRTRLPRHTTRCNAGAAAAAACYRGGTFRDKTGRTFYCAYGAARQRVYTGAVTCWRICGMATLLNTNVLHLTAMTARMVRPTTAYTDTLLCSVFATIGRTTCRGRCTALDVAVCRVVIGISRGVVACL